jgi:dTDP-4-dehydrorhamnose reductase
LITGGTGMLGRTLARVFSDLEVVSVGSKDADLTLESQARRLVKESRATVVLHSAAMTAVDLCETERERAFQLNALATEYVARAARDSGARLITISTDYVFAGTLDRPYHEWDACGPNTVYGFTKRLAEEAAQRECNNHLIVRTAWLYGEEGPSFVHTMSKLGAEDGAPLRVVRDQLGNPTSTLALARHLRRVLDVPVKGTMHLSCEGETSWFGFARAIFEHHGFKRVLEPCTTADFPRPAPRPANSRLDKRVLRLLGLPPMPTWQDALAEFLGSRG